MNDFTEKQKMNIAYFRSNLERFLCDELLIDKHVIVKDEKIQKSFDTLEAAVSYAIDNFREGDYIIQQIIDENASAGFIWSAVG